MMTVGNEFRIKSPLVLLIVLFPVSVLLFWGKPFLIGFLPLGFFSLFQYWQFRKKKKIEPGINLKETDQQNNLHIDFDQFLFLESSESNTYIYYVNKGQVVKMSLKGSLKYFEDQLKNKPILRCHSSYVINVDQVRFVDGNTKGVKLYLRHYDEAIPVSKKLSGTISSVLRDISGKN